MWLALQSEMTLIWLLLVCSMCFKEATLSPMKLEVVVSAKQANPVYTGFARNGQGKRDYSLDNSDGKDWITKVECKTEDDCNYHIQDEYLTIYIIGNVKNTPDTLSLIYTEVVRHRPKHVPFSSSAALVE